MDAGEIVAVTSELTLAEVLVKPFQDANLPAQKAYRSFLTPTLALQIVPVDSLVLLEAARLRAVARVKLPDAIHLATANRCGCDSFLTNDIALQSALSANVKILACLSLV